MNKLTIVARVLLGLLFTFAGVAGFYVAFNPPPTEPGYAGMFQTAFFGSHFALFVDAVQGITGFFILINRYVPLALVTLAAVIANILVFHSTMAPLGVFPGFIAAVLWFVVASSVRGSFAPLLVARVATVHADVKGVRGTVEA